MISSISLLMYLQYFDIDNQVAISVVAMQRILSTGVSMLLGIIFAGLLGIRKSDADSDTE